MTKPFLAGRLAVFLLFLIVTVGSSAGQTPETATPSRTEPTKTEPSTTTPGQATSKDPATTAPGPGTSRDPSTETTETGTNPTWQDTFERWGLSLHSGISIPHGEFNTFFNPGPNVGVDLEYRITRTFSLEGIYGFHRFGSEDFGIVHHDHLNLHQFSFNGKVYGSTSPTRPFFNFGGGAYRFPGNTHGGLNVGGGVQFDVRPTIAVDVMYNFHNVFTSGSSTRFSTAQAGVRFRF